MSAIPVARAVLPAGEWALEKEVGRVTLRWEERRRRRGVVALDGARQDVLLDLPRGRRLDDGDGLALADGGIVRVVAAREPVLEIRAGASSLAQLAYHLGNRHLPVEIASEFLATPADPLVADMVRRLGGEARTADRAFDPERGAYDEHGHDRQR
jgi:urease accessory protein